MNDKGRTGASEIAADTVESGKAGTDRIRDVVIAATVYLWYTPCEI